VRVLDHAIEVGEVLACAYTHLHRRNEAYATTAQSFYERCTVLKAHIMDAKKLYEATMKSKATLMEVSKSELCFVLFFLFCLFFWL
jgi:hypothetical protein